MPACFADAYEGKLSNYPRKSKRADDEKLAREKKNFSRNTCRLSTRRVFSVPQGTY